MDIWRDIWRDICMRDGMALHLQVSHLSNQAGDSLLARQPNGWGKDELCVNTMMERSASQRGKCHAVG